MCTKEKLAQLDWSDKINLLHQLVNELLPNEIPYTKASNGKMLPTVAEELVDYEVIKPRTFQDYFKLNLTSAQIAEMLGYTYIRQRIDFSTMAIGAEMVDSARLTNLLDRIEEGLRHVGMQSEMARREFLIAPILLEVIHYTNAQLQVEYAIKADESLQGSLDYLLMSGRLLVVEAKNGELQRGFHQLMAQLSALDRKNVSPDEQYFGIISMGDGWQFGQLDRKNQVITQDTEHYGVPINTELLLRIMIGILQRD